MHRTGWSYLFPSAAHEFSYPPQKSELTCQSAHENFVALEDSVDVPPDLGIFDEDWDGDVLLSAFD